MANLPSFSLSYVATHIYNVQVTVKPSGLTVSVDLYTSAASDTAGANPIVTTSQVNSDINGSNVSTGVAQQYNIPLTNLGSMVQGGQYNIFVGIFINGILYQNYVQGNITFAAAIQVTVGQGTWS